MNILVLLNKILSLVIIFLKIYKNDKIYEVKLYRGSFPKTWSQTCNTIANNASLLYWWQLCFTSAKIAHVFRQFCFLTKMWVIFGLIKHYFHQYFQLPVLMNLFKDESLFQWPHTCILDISVSYSMIQMLQAYIWQWIHGFL